MRFEHDHSSCIPSPSRGDHSRHPFPSQKPVMLMTGLSASGIYDLMNRGLFPKSIKLPGGKSVAWLLSDIEEWQRQVIATANSANDAWRRSS